MFRKVEWFFSNRGFILQRNIYSSNGTKIYFANETNNQLEKKSFLKLEETAKAFNVLGKSESNNELFLPSEHSIDARFVLSLLDDFVSKNSNFIDAFVEKIDKKSKRNFEITINSNTEKLNFDKVILAAGSKSSYILKKSSLIKHDIPYCLNGVGTLRVIWIRIFK